MTAPILEVTDVGKSFGKTVALGGVSFRVDRGELFGLLGPNGAGKTTLLSIISGLTRPDAGRVTVLGRDIGSGDIDARRQIGLVPQELALYAELTARENLLFFGSLYGLDRPALRERAERVLRAAGLAERGEDRVTGFSGGMKRRLNLAVALMHAPPLLLLDEPTTGVDPQSRNHLFEEIRRLNREGTTVVYTSHYMEEVQALCRRVGILDHGRLIACDHVATLVRQLPGLIRLRVPGAPSRLSERLKELDGVRVLNADGDTIALQCQDVKGALIRIVTVLNEQQIELTSLETEEPNLERVFLHLTGRALRD